MRGGGVSRRSHHLHRHPSRNLIRPRRIWQQCRKNERRSPRRRRIGAATREGNVQMLTVLAPLIVFGLVIFVHELGHFIAAKITGVYAPRFSIGFGPALLKKRFGETEYQLAAIPLGGYVRMASRAD